MKLNKSKSLKSKVFFVIFAFAVIILGLIWLFQIILLDKFYEVSKVDDLNDATSLVKKSYNDNTLFEDIDNISRDNGICVQILTNSNDIYDSTSFNRGCLPDKQFMNYKNEFINSLSDNETYRLINPRFNNEILIKALKINTNTYIFLSTSLDPLDSAVGILRKQFIFVTIIVLLLSFIIAYYISKRIAKPIVTINGQAKRLASGDYDNAIFYIDEDIEELNELVKTLNHTSKELAKTENLRNELLANVSHDLKTPLTMIKAYAEMVRDLTFKDKKKREDNLNVIIEESDRLNLLVNDILDYTKITSLDMNLNIESFDINELIDEVINKFSIKETEGFNFIFDFKDKLMVKADRLKISRVIYNLINNALNYTGKDKTITIKVDNNKDDIKVNIIDTGKGISKEDIKLIWKKYYKVDKQYRRDKHGSGIGLSIVESILKAHNVDYGVDSKENEGSNFYFYLNK